MQKGILVVGSTNMDMVVTAENFPKPGETLLGQKFQTFPGGKGANQAVGTAKLGASTYFITKMGDDEFRIYLTENLKKNGVNTENIFISKNESTGVAVIVVDSKGENEIIVVSGSNMQLSPDEIEISAPIFEKCGILLLQLEIPLDAIQKAIEIAKIKKLQIILNPAPARFLPDDLLESIDFLTPNETELETLTGLDVTDEESAIKGAEILLAKGVKNVIVTMGEKGSILVNDNEVKIYAAKKVEAVDTTAAGDAFNAGLAYSISKKYPIDKAIKFSNIVAALAVTKMGAQSSMPARAEVEALL